MVEEDAVAELHLVAYEVASLIVAHTAPAGCLFRGFGEVLDREAFGLGFEEPEFLVFGHAVLRGAGLRPAIVRQAGSLPHGLFALGRRAIELAFEVAFAAG